MNGSFAQRARIMQAADRDARPWSDDMDDADLYGRAARQAEQHLADMRRNDPERYAMLQAEWEAEGEAYDRFCNHGNRRLYDIELRAIDERYGS